MPGKIFLYCKPLSFTVFLVPEDFEFELKIPCVGIFSGTVDFEFQRNIAWAGSFPGTKTLSLSDKFPCTVIFPGTQDFDFWAKKSLYRDFSRYLSATALKEKRKSNDKRSLESSNIFEIQKHLADN